MHLFLKIGDLSLSVVEIVATAGDTRHSITVTDAWNHKDEKNLTPPTTAVVANEPEAIEVVQDFLQIDGATGPFRKLFPQHC